MLHYFLSLSLLTKFVLLQCGFKNARFVGLHHYVQLDVECLSVLLCLGHYVDIPHRTRTKKVATFAQL